MSVISLKTRQKYGSLLAGNEYYIPPSFESIASATASGGESSLSFTSIPSTYQHLQIRGIYRGNVNTGSLYMQFNSDTSSNNYAMHYLEAYAYSSAQAVTAGGRSSGTAASAIWLHWNGGIAYGVSSSIFSSAIIDIHDYSSTTKNKTARAIAGTEQNTTTDSLTLSSGLWLSTSAISSIQLFPTNSAQFGSGTQFALYGIKGA